MNINALAGMRCPKCRSEGPFRIEVRKVLTMHDDGSEDEGGDEEWNNESYCKCCKCPNDWAGTVADFRVPKFTPGPWVHRATAGNHDFAIYDEATGRDLALVRDFHEPNARLIVESPTMYELLAAALEAIDPFLDETPKNAEDERLWALHASISQLQDRVEGRDT